MTLDQLPQYAPVSLSEQIREVRGQLAKHVNTTAWNIRHKQMSEAYAAAELQRLQSVLRTLEALQDLLGPDAALTREQIRQRLNVRQEKAA